MSDQPEDAARLERESMAVLDAMIDQASEHVAAEMLRVLNASAPAGQPVTWETVIGDVVTVWESTPGDWRWHVTAGNGEVLEQGEGHTRREDAVRAAVRYHPAAGEATP